MIHSSSHSQIKLEDPKDEEEQNPLIDSTLKMSSDRDDKKKSTSFVLRNYNSRRRLPLVIICSVLALILLYFTSKSMGNSGASTYLGGVRPDPTVEKKAKKGLAMMSKTGGRLAITSWNIAAINNNPWEYWISYPEEPEYDQLMMKIEDFIVKPGDKDLPVNQVFTEAMFTQLDKRMTGVGWNSVRNYWENDFRDRKIVTSFLTDPMLGKKRLASMPDRITNTINTRDGQVFRPTVINMYEGDLSTVEKWWTAWETFMFDTPVEILGLESKETKIPYELLQPIKKSKYPSITSEEEVDSLPLQTMCGAIFDSILVHMMNTVATSPAAWQNLKATMVENLNKKKNPHTIEILEKSYSDSDIITLQEVAYSFIEQIRSSKLGKKFHIVYSTKIDAVRDQNSVIALNKDTFPKGSILEISSLVEKSFPPGAKVPVATGDILATTAETKDGIPLVIASFHGDTDGLATKPVLTATLKAMAQDSQLAGHRLIFGMDANTYEHPKPGEQQDVLDFGLHFVALGLTSAWGDVPDPKNYTTYNSRTYLQPQLNKACKVNEKRSKGDVNPKDFILFPKKDFRVIETWKDNTGNKKYMEDIPFPTLDFPSDHGILHTLIESVHESSAS